MAGAGTIDEPRQVRRALINLLRSNSGGWPFGLVHQVISALEGLDYGDTSPIFKPRRNGRKAGLSVLRYQLRAICFVEYRRRQGITKPVAQERVAAAFGVARETVDSWENRLPDAQALGRLEFASSIAFAHNAAVNSKLDSHNELLYGDGALLKAGKEYQAMLRDKKNKTHKKG